MNAETHFGKFDQAAKDMLAMGSLHPELDANTRSLCLRASSHIRKSAHFYVPSACDIIVGKIIDADMKETLRLPYERVSVLTELNYDRRPAYMITLASTNLKDMSQVIQRPIDQGFVLFSLVATSDTKAINGYTWGAYKGRVIVNLTDKTRNGFEVISIDDRLDLSKGYESSILSVFTLCAMLNTVNTKAHEIKPPEKLNKKRAKHGNLPLYSYHVLNVDGELWDSPKMGSESVDGEHNGMRSHYRRGHIRRLHGGADRVWVRSTFVHGSVPGFVAKDYNIKEHDHAQSNNRSVAR